MTDRRRSANRVMSVTGHLREMRNRAAICAAVLFAAVAAALAFAEELVGLLTAMGMAAGYRFVFIAPQELILQYFRVAFAAGFAVAMPMALYQLWAFVSPGLEARQRRMMGFSLAMGLFCFALGVMFAYRIVMPLMLRFLIGVGSTYITAEISVESYISFLLTVFMIFGCIFEMPVVSTVLARFGILHSAMMAKARRVAVVVIFIVAAVITPPDVFSQVLVALPMVGLYEISRMLVAVTERRRRHLQVSHISY